MKQKLLKSFLLLCSFIVGSSVWADTKDLTFNLSSNPGGWPTANSTTLTDYTYTLNEVDYTFALSNVKCNSGYLMLTATAALGLPAIDGYKLTKVEATNSGGCSTSTKVGISSSSSEAKYVAGGGIQTWSTTSTTYTYNLTETSVNTMYYMYVTNKNAQVVTLKLTYETDVPVNEVTFSYADHKGQTVPDYGANITLSKTDVDITNTWYYCAYTDSYATFFGTNGSGTITITPKNGATITKVVFKTPYTSYNGYQSDGKITASEGDLSINTVDKADATETTWEGSATSAFTLTYHKTIRWTSIVVTYTGGTPTCETPIISGETPFLTYTTVSITCPTSGALIQYCTSTDGVNYTPYTPYAAPFQISTTTQVKAKATKEGLADSKEAYKIFSQQGSIPNIKYLVSVGTAPQYVQLENALVTYKNGNTAYLKDATDAILLFNCAGDLEAGDKINGYMHVTDYKVYNGLPEITEFELVEGYTKTSGNEVTPTVMTLAGLLGGDQSSPYEMYLSQYVKIENATVTSAFNSKSCTITQGNYEIVLRDQNSTATLTSKVGDVITVTGFVAIYGTTKQIAVYEQSQIEVQDVPAVASVDVSSKSIEVPAAGKDGTINVTYNNITSVVAGVKFYEADGKTETIYSWLEAKINSDNNVDYTVAPNTGVARTAYLKVYALDDDANEVYSELISIAQAGYVVDYATLPFEFNGGINDIASTPGLTQEGIGKDYASSPKLKFDGTGDYLILKINEAPGTLTFDIKGNGFSDGTFTVQTSADGENYTDLETYTELGDVQNESFDLDATVRYIKWIYTEKVTGNVGLGNIKLGKPGDATPTLIVTKTSLEGFTYVQENGPSEVQDFDVSGENLVGDVTLEVSEPSFFEISVSETTNFDTKLVLHKTEVDGSKKIFVRLKAGYPQDNSYSGYIQINSQGAEEKVVYLNGSVTPSALEDPYFVWNLTTNSYIDASEDQVSWLSFFASMIAERYDNTKTKANNYLGGDANARTSSRFYNGSTLTITPSKGYTITSVEFLATSASYAAALKESTWTNATASVDEKTVTVTPTDGSAAFYAKIGGTVGVETVTYYISKDITIDETGYATYIAPANVKFPSGLTAYVVSEVKNNEASLQKVTAVAEDTPVILKGEGTYTVEVVTYDECDKVESNMLKGSFGTDKGDGTIYVLAKVNSTIAFFPVGEGSIIPAGRAYLQVPVSEAGAKAFYFSFEDEDADGINSLTPALSEGEGAIFNLAGQRISKMQKGINIVNGKKVLR